MNSFHSLILLANAWQYLFGVLMFLISVFLILLVLVQRGRGGGLAGAFGGMGGQSAFGTKAGDLFTRITIGAATVWILLCICAILVLNRDTSVFGSGAPGGGPSLDAFGEPPASASPDKGGDAAASSPAPAGGGLDTGDSSEGSEQTVAPPEDSQ